MPSVALFAAGTDAGRPATVTAYTPDGHTLWTRQPFGASFRGGARVAVGDINGDGVPDVIAGAGAGTGPAVVIYNGNTGQQIRSFYAYSQKFTGGVFVAAADVNGDGYADVITGAGAGAGPDVSVFDGRTGTRIHEFFAQAPNFTGGVPVAAGDVNGDGFADVIAGAAAGGAPAVLIYNGNTAAKQLPLLSSFYAYSRTFHGGVWVGAGDTNGDGKAEVITGTGKGGDRAATFNGLTGAQLTSVTPFGAFTGGVRVAAADVNGDGKADVITALGAGGSKVRVFDGRTGQQAAGPVGSFFPTDPTFTGGVFVGGQQPVGPAAIVGAPASSAEGSAISLTSSVVNAPASNPFAYSWSVTKNGHPYPAAGTTGPTFAFAPDDNGAYAVTLAVTNTATRTRIPSVGMTITVTDVAPTPTITGIPVASSPEGTAITLGSGVDDLGNADVAAGFTYAWSVTKNGSPFQAGTGAGFSFTPDDNGVYAVSLTVTDKDGGVGTVSRMISVADVAPTPSIVSVSTPRLEGTAVSVTGAAIDPGVLDTLSYRWSVFKNGVATPFQVGGNGTNFTFTPDDNGSYRVVFTATDKDGASSATEQTVGVANVAPAAAITGAPVTSPEGGAITLTGRATDPGSADAAAGFSFAWSVTKNGGAYAGGNGTSFTFTPDDNGIYVITLKATDKDGDAGMATQTVTVINVAPTAAISGAPAAPVVEGTAVALASVVSDPGSADAFAYSWSVTKDGNAFPATDNAAAEFGFTPAGDGTYVVTLTVTDKDGGVGTDQATFTATLTDEHFALQLALIDAQQPLPTSGFALDWTQYNGLSPEKPGEVAVFDVAAWYAGKPGTYALDLDSLTADRTAALAELRTRVSNALAALEPNVTYLEGVFEATQDTTFGVSAYSALRGLFVQQATLRLLDQDLANVQAVRDEEADRVAALRDLALYSVSTPPPDAPAGTTVAGQLAAVRAQEDALAANLGTYATGRQAALHSVVAAEFFATVWDALVASDEIQAASTATRTALDALQAREAELQDVLIHPLDHVTWPAVSGVDFAVAMLSGSFRPARPAPDEQTLVTLEPAGQPASVVIRDSRTGDVLRTVVGPASLKAAAATADGKIWVLTGDNTVDLRELSTGQVLWELHDDAHAFSTLTPNGDGSLVALSSYNVVTVLRWNGTTVTRSGDFTLPAAAQDDIHWDRSGNFLAVPIQSKLGLLNVTTGDLYQFDGFHDWVDATAWSGDGTMVAAGDSRGFVQIIDVPTKQKIGSFQLPVSDSVRTIAFSPNQALVVTADTSVGLIFWDVTRMDQIHEYARSTGRKDLAFFQESLTGNTLLARAADGLVAYAMPVAGRGAPISRATPPILNPVPPTPPPSPDHPAWPSSTVPGTLGSFTSPPFSSLSADGQSLVVPAGPDVRFVSIATGQTAKVYPIGGTVRFAAPAGDGQSLVVVSDDGQRGMLTVRNLTTGTVGLTVPLPAIVNGAAVDAAHNLAALGNQSGGSRVQIIDLTTGATEDIARTEGHGEAVSISGSGQYVAVGLTDGTVVVYDRTKRQSHALTGLHGAIRALAWSHGAATLLAAADDNGHLALYSPTSALPLSVFSSPYDSDPTTGLQFSANNLLLFRGATANGLVAFDASNPAAPTVSGLLPRVPIRGASNLLLSQTGATLFLSDVDESNLTDITGLTIPAYGTTPSTSDTPPPVPMPPPSLPPLDSAQQNELAAPTAIGALNPTQQQYLLDSVTAYFSERVKEGGDAGVPSFYLQLMESNPALLGLGTASSYRDFYRQLVADLRSKWPLQNPPSLDALAGGSGIYVPPSEPPPAPDPSSIQVGQQQTAEQLVIQNLYPPVRLSAGQWVNVLNANPDVTTHVGAERYAVDLNLLGAPDDARPDFDRGQPIYAPMAGVVVRVDRANGQLVLEHQLTQSDGTPVTVTTVYFHLKIDDAIADDAGTRRTHVAQGQQIGQIWDLTDGTIQGDGETFVTPHLHFSVHLSGEKDRSIDLTEWLRSEKIGTVYTTGADTGTENGPDRTVIVTPPKGTTSTNPSDSLAEALSWSNGMDTLVLGATTIRNDTLAGRLALGLWAKLRPALATVAAVDNRHLFDAYDHVLDVASKVTGIGVNVGGSPNGPTLAAIKDRLTTAITSAPRPTSRSALETVLARAIRDLFQSGQYLQAFTAAKTAAKPEAHPNKYDNELGSDGKPLAQDLVTYRVGESVRVRFDAPLEGHGGMAYAYVYLLDADGGQLGDDPISDRIQGQLHADVPVTAILARVWTSLTQGDVPHGRFRFKVGVWYTGADQATHAAVTTDETVTVAANGLPRPVYSAPLKRQITNGAFVSPGIKVEQKIGRHVIDTPQATFTVTANVVLNAYSHTPGQTQYLSLDALKLQKQQIVTDLDSRLGGAVIERSLKTSQITSVSFKVGGKLFKFDKFYFQFSTTGLVTLVSEFQPVELQVDGKLFEASVSWEISVQPHPQPPPSPPVYIPDFQDSLRFIRETIGALGVAAGTAFINLPRVLPDVVEEIPF